MPDIDVSAETRAMVEESIRVDARSAYESCIFFAAAGGLPTFILLSNAVFLGHPALWAATGIYAAATWLQAYRARIYRDIAEPPHA